MTDHEKDMENLKLEIDILKKDLEFLDNECGLYMLTTDSLKKQLSIALMERDEARREVMWSIIDQACRDEDVEKEYEKRGWQYLKKDDND